MAVDNTGQVMGAQGSGPHVQHQAGAGMKQRHQMGDGKTAPGLLASRLATMVLEFGRIRHGETGTIDPKGAMAQPTSLVQGLVLEAVADGP